MKIRLWLAAVTLSTASVPVNAADWWLVTWNGHTPHATAVFMDAELLTQKDGRVGVWTLLIFETPENGVASAKELMSLDCPGRSIETQAVAGFDANDHSTISGFVPEEQRQRAPIIPDTQGEEFFKFGCLRNFTGTQIGTNRPKDVADMLFSNLRR